MRGVLIAVLLFTACGDDDSGDPRGYVRIDDYASAMKSARCAYYVRCGFLPDQATCASASIAELELPSSLVASVKAGRTIYNGNDAKVCIDAIANATCDKTDEAGRVQPLACREQFHGTLDADATCNVDEECISERCTAIVDQGTCMPGHCVGNFPPATQQPRKGELCNPTIGCAPGSRCGDTGLCEPLHGDGESCVTTADCAYGLGCAGTSRTCRVLPAPGQPCPDGECRDDGTRCTATGCVALGLDGARCQSSIECSSFYRCDFSTSTCKRLPSTGDACTSSGSPCFDESFCNSSLRCEAYHPAGATCATSLECASRDCDFTTNTCVEPPTCR